MLLLPPPHLPPPPPAPDVLPLPPITASPYPPSQPLPTPLHSLSTPLHSLSPLSVLSVRPARPYPGSSPEHSPVPPVRWQDITTDGSPQQFFLRHQFEHYGALPVEFYGKDIDYPAQQKEVHHLEALGG